MQVITITPSGEVSGLQRKRGQGFDLRSLGPAKIERASEIMPTEDGQRWYIHVRTGPHADEIVSSRLLSLAGLIPNDLEKVTSDWQLDLIEGTPFALTFADYDDAVKVEIAFLDALRLQGVF